jgi:hypothetical protein
MSLVVTGLYSRRSWPQSLLFAPVAEQGFDIMDAPVELACSEDEFHCLAREG